MSFPHFALNSEGQVQAVTEGTVTSFNGPQAYVGSSPLVTEDAVAATDTFNGGLRYRSDGALRVNDGAGEFYSQGFAVTANGQLCIDTGAVAAGGTQGGVATTSDGRVYMSTGGSAYTGPLDLMPGAFRAYGQRAMSGATIDNNLYTLRAGVATQAFAPDAAGDAPIDAINTFRGVNPASTILWNDNSGNAFHLPEDAAPPPVAPGWSVIGASARPAVGPISSGVTAAGTVLFNETPAEFSGAFTFLVVSYKDAGTTQDTEIACFSSGNAFFTMSIRGDEVYLDVSDESSNYAQWDCTGDFTGLHLFRFVVQTDGTTTIFMDGINQNAENIGGETPVPIDVDCVTWQIALQEITGEAFVLDGLYELLVYNSVLSGGNLALLEPDMQAYYGTPALP